ELTTMDHLLTNTTFFQKVQGAFIALDPATGQIRALVGGRDFAESQFNRAIQAKRQPGSSFKPFIYTAAIDNGFKTTDMLNDSPAVYYNDGTDWTLIGRTTDYSDIPPELQEVIDFENIEQIWTPGNYTNRYRGKITLRTALEKSINLCSIELLKKIGPSSAAYYAKRMGIKSRISPYLSMALGSFVVTPLEITNAFSTIANMGVKTKPYSVIKIYDHKNRVLEDNFPRQKEVISQQTAYQMISLLKGVVQRGTGGYARRLRRTAAGKTGTTNDYTDAWFIGFTPQLVAGVWVGYDNASIRLGDKKAGGVVACPIWTDFMKIALRDLPNLEFPVPKGIVFAPADKQTGFLALTPNEHTYMESFKKGSMPKRFAIHEQAEHISKQEKEENLLIEKTINKIMDDLVINTTYYDEIRAKVYGEKFKEEEEEIETE
ncbi:penicillin-binding transpeptidase domain-containing protein, partial [bacterium]